MKKNIYYLQLLACVVGICISCYMIFNYYYHNYIQKKTQEQLSNLVEDSSEASQLKSTKNGILPEYEKLYEKNTDMVGWIKIDGTNINYPVMQTPNSPNFYLRRDFEKNYAQYGSLYVQEDCNVKKPSDNLIIYGHNMKNGTMFAELEKFTEKDFWEQNNIISFDTLTEKDQYKILAVFKMRLYTNDPNEFEYYNFVDAKSSDEFDNFVVQCKALSIFDTEIDAVYGDKLITLSTCEYSKKDGRLVIVAKKIK